MIPSATFRTARLLSTYHQEDHLHGSLKFPFRHPQANHSVLLNLFKALPTTSQLLYL